MLEETESKCQSQIPTANELHFHQADTHNKRTRGPHPKYTFKSTPAGSDDSLALGSPWKS